MDYILYFAAERGFLNIIQFIKTKVSIDDNLEITNNDKPTLIKAITTNAIAKAFFNGHLEIIKQLLQLPNNDPTFKDYNYYSGILSGAVRYLDIIKFLLFEVPGVDAQQLSLAAFERAVDSGQIDTLQFLLSHFPDISTNRSHSNATMAFERAVRVGRLDVVKILVQRCENIDYTSLLTAAAETGQLEVVKYLVTLPQINVCNNETGALFCAVEANHIDVVNFWAVRDGVDLGARDNFVLRKMAERGNLETVKLLVGLSGVDPTAEDNEAVRNAASHGHSEVVKFLLTLPGVQMI
ncbi:hypothetical protein HDU76_005949 [Blyttiomyces sp. JEL0837]|nr:hypothetical protein HDU76_005949 [Blyttiomyces sp. JEL0837]